MGEQKTIEQTFQIESPEIEVGLLGTRDKFVSLIEQGMDVEIRPFGENLKVSGQEEDVKLTIDVFRALISLLNQGIRIHSTDIVSAMKMAHRGTLEYFADLYSETIIKDRRGRAIRVKNFGQRQYVNAMKHNDITFGIGPAGTGKTYLAVAMAVASLKRGEVERIILTRPAVEAGESLGFLPGDLREKVDPYYSLFMPPSYIYEDCERMISKVLKRQIEMKNINNQRLKEGKKKIDDRILVVMDDCISDSKIWRKSKDLGEIIYNGRHYNITLIIVSQDIVAIPPNFRSNIDIVMLFNTSIQEELKKLYQHYAGEFSSLQEFKDTLNAVCQDYGTLVILKRGYKSLNLSDKIFRYKANINLRPKTFGCQKYKMLNRKYYNSEWLNDYNKYTFGGIVKNKTNVKLV